MTVFLAIVCICLLIPILAGVALIMTGKLVYQKPPALKVIDEAPSIEDVAKRYKLLDHQDWEHEFRKLNKGKPWDYVPRKPGPLRKIIDPDGAVVEIHSWQGMVDEEMICNPCARNNHRKCVAAGTNPNDWDSCYCDCIVDEDE